MEFMITLIAAPNSHLIFCFCNLIIITIVLINKGLNPNSAFPDQEIKVCISTSTIHGFEKNQEEGEKEITITDEINIEETFPNRGITDVAIDDDEEDEGEGNNGCSAIERNEEDELKRRAEEFIEKINKTWKAEKLAALGFSVI